MSVKQKTSERSYQKKRQGWQLLNKICLYKEHAIDIHLPFCSQYSINYFYVVLRILCRCEAPQKIH